MRIGIIFARRPAAFGLAIAAAFAGIVALIAYPFANKAATALVALSFVCMTLGAAASVAGAVRDIHGAFAIVAPAFFALGFISALADNATAFMLYFFGVAQGSGEMGAPNAAFWVSLVALLAATLAASAACFFGTKKENQNIGGKS